MRAPNSNRSGVTLLEILVATALLAGVVLGGLRLFSLLVKQQSTVDTMIGRSDAYQSLTKKFRLEGASILQASQATCANLPACLAQTCNANSWFDCAFVDSTGAKLTGVTATPLLSAIDGGPCSGGKCRLSITGRFRLVGQNVEAQWSIAPIANVQSGNEPLRTFQNSVLVPIGALVLTCGANQVVTAINDQGGVTCAPRYKTQACAAPNFVNGISAAGDFNCATP